MTLPPSRTSPLANGAWWAVVSPIVMSVLLLRVSGVGLLEKGIVKRRPEYARDHERVLPRPTTS